MTNTPMTIRELRTMIQLVIDKAERDIATFAGETNPQIVEIRKRIEAEKSFAVDVLDAAHGSRQALRLRGRDFDASAA